MIDQATSSSAAQGPVKYFVVDTNVLLHNPNALFMFEENRVILPFMVIEELDKFKKNNDDTGRNARQVIRHLDALRQKGKLSEGVKWNGHGGLIQIDLNDYPLPPSLTEHSPDNLIISVAWHYMQQGERAVFISKDINCRIKSDALGITTQDFEAQKVDADRLSKGYRDVHVPSELIDRLYRDKHVSIDEVADQLVVDDPSSDEPMAVPLHANKYLILHSQLDESHTGMARCHIDEDNQMYLAPVTPHRKPVYGLFARNAQQTMALDLLLDDETQLVSLLGTAGSGKTLLAVAAALQKTLVEGRYDRVLVARPIMPLGRDLGYLPGDKDQKLNAWMQPIFDNLSYLLSTRGAGNQHAESKTLEQRINELMADGSIILEPLTYIRGRSIPHQYMIVDEAQNLTPHEVKTIVSRVGEGTKLVLTGDIAQIDNPYLDSSSNGLSYVVEHLKQSHLAGHVLLQKSERSALASLASEYL